MYQFTSLLCIIHTVPPPTVSVQVNPSSTEVPSAGSSFSLSCVALELLAGLTGVPETEWIGPDGGVVQSMGGITVGTPVAGGGTITTQVLTFSSIRTSHAGEYSCRASIESPALSVRDVVEEPFIITVQGNRLIN